MLWHLEYLYVEGIMDIFKNCQACGWAYNVIYDSCPHCKLLARAGLIEKEIEKKDLKDYSTKLPMSTMQWKAFTSDRGVAGVFKFAMKKYGNVSSWRNRTSESLERYESALLRHYAKYKNGETIDPESGLHHFAAMAWNALSLLEFIIEDEEKNEKTTGFLAEHD
jgi:hypothetical protein